MPMVFLCACSRPLLQPATQTALTHSSPSTFNHGTIWTTPHLQQPPSCLPAVGEDVAFYTAFLRKCTLCNSLPDGKLVHHCIVQDGLELDGFLANLLLQMYGKCCALVDTVALFSYMPQRDQYAWNFMIRAYGHAGRGDEALILFEDMQKEGFAADKYIFSSLLSACAMEKGLAKGQELHTSIVYTGLDPDRVVGNNLVCMYGKCGKIEDARNVFQALPDRTTISWTVLISAYAQLGINRDLLLLLEEMQRDGASLDKVTFLSILSACSDKADLAGIKRIHEFIKYSGFGSDIALGNALIFSYGKHGSMVSGWKVFNEMEHRDMISWSTMITVSVNCGQSEEALKLFHQMKVEGFFPNKYTYISVLGAYANQDFLGEGKQLHAIISSHGLESEVAVGTALLNMYKNCGSLENALISYKGLLVKDEAANASMLSACANHGALAEGRSIHASIVLCGRESDKNVEAVLVTLYGKCGSVGEAQKLFDLVLVRDPALWNALAGAYAQNGRGREAFCLFQQMRQEEVKPDEAIHNSILSACSHAGLVDEACCCFLLLSQTYGRRPVIDHYNCMADILARAGRLEDAEILVDSMPLQPSIVSWLSLVSICRTQYDVERGESTTKHVMELDLEHTAAYVMLSNIYAWTEEG